MHILRELTEKKLHTYDSLSSTPKPSVSLSRSQSNDHLSSDSDFEDKPKVIGKRKKAIARTLDCDSDDGSDDTGY